MIGKETTLAVAYQATDNCLDIGLPEIRYLGAVSVALADSVGVALEYAHDNDYDISEGGTGEDANILTFQLALAF